MASAYHLLALGRVGRRQLRRIQPHLLAARCRPGGERFLEFVLAVDSVSEAPGRRRAVVVVVGGGRPIGR